MIFDISDSEFTILDVFKIERSSNQHPGTCHGRPITSLSCRTSGHSELESKGVRYRATTENCLLIGANTPFTHFYDEEEVIAVHLSFSKNAPEGIELIPYQSPEIRERFISLYSIWVTKAPGYISKCKSLIYDIFYIFLSEGEQKGDVEMIRSSMKYLYSNYMKENFSIENMISHAYISPAYFRRIFKNIYGTTVVKFVNSLRVEYAKTLMSSRKYTIAEIAHLSGFADEKYFSRIFRQTTGSAPSEYR